MMRWLVYSLKKSENPPLSVYRSGLSLKIEGTTLEEAKQCWHDKDVSDFFTFLCAEPLTPAYSALDAAADDDDAFILQRAILILGYNPLTGKVCPQTFPNKPGKPAPQLPPECLNPQKVDAKRAWEAVVSSCGGRTRATQSS